MDLDTRGVTWSDTLFDLYGVDPADWPRPHRQDLAGVHPDDCEMLQTAVDECEYSGTAIEVRYRSIRPSDGELRWFEVRGQRVTDGEGAPRLTGSVIDISDQVWAKDILESDRDDAVAESLQKSSFLANMSHEIRTPMNGVIGMTGLLLDTQLDVNQRDFVDTIRGSGEALLTIINDILDFSKIESGELDLECHPFDLRECMEATLAVAAATETRGIEILGQLDDRCPLRVLGDATRLRQVLVNLVGNAMKFTENGHVLLTIEPDRDHPGGDGLRISVSDTGIGIAADRLGILFDSYSQVDSSTTRLYGGTGLGLAISDRLIRAMGGTLHVESVVGEGSTFSFSIELGAALESGAAGAPDPSARLNGQHALVVDDNPTNRRILRYQLEGWSMRVSDAESGAEALTLIEAGATFDVALVDMKMPQMTGEELAVSLSDAGKAIPLILVSACRWQLSRSDLFSAILTKPVMNARLRDSLLEAIWPSRPLPKGSSEMRECSKQTRAMRVLLVEDNSVNQRVGRLILEKLGHRVDLAGNGLEAVHAVNLMPYDAVFMDIQMPEMNGLDATRMIRAGTLPFRQPYVIAVTANATVEDQRECLEAGMDEFLTKPIRIGHFKAALERADAYAVPLSVRR
jgi:signal transduction histidine kinase/CheY-like chemotaxis protein